MVLLYGVGVGAGDVESWMLKRKEVKGAELSGFYRFLEKRVSRS